MNKTEIKTALMNAWSLEIVAREFAGPNSELVTLAEGNRLYLEKLAEHEGINTTALARRLMKSEMPIYYDIDFYRHKLVDLTAKN